MMNGRVSPPVSKRQKLESTTTKKAVTSFFTPTSKKEPEKITWRVVQQTLLLGRYQPHPENQDRPSQRRKIAAFDLDSTLIETASGNTFAKDATDWRWWHASVPGRLKELYAEGYHIAILSNQGSVALQADSKSLKSEQRSLSRFKAKVSAVLNHFEFPVTLLAATSRDGFRKPRVGMWRELLDELDLDEGDGPALDDCLFVGDAGGRAAAEGRRADHACCDRDLAANVGITFATPEEYFHNEDVAPFTRDFEPAQILDEVFANAAKETPAAIEKHHAMDIIVMVGSPGSGKSTFYWTKLQPLGYARVNQDILKSRDKCVKAAVTFLDEQQSVAVDNTNADPETRAVWTRLAAKYKIPIRCVYLTAHARLCQHNDTVRALADSKTSPRTFNPEKRSILPHSAFAGFHSRFVEPTLAEGFEEIFRMDFRFEGDEDMRKIWSMYWL